MAEQLGEIEQRLDSVGQLSSVVSAMRGIAAARLREADARLEGIRTYASTIGDAIGQALALLPARDSPGQDGQGGPSRQSLIIALCSEQGFVGGFNGHILDEAVGLAASRGEARLVIVGDRGLAGAKERGFDAVWSMPMAAHAEEVIPLANRLAEHLYDELQRESVDQVLLVHGIPGQGRSKTETRTLIPFDYVRFPSAKRSFPPLLNLQPQVLLASLAEEYVFAEICEAVMLSYAAENEARMQAMTTARDNVSDKLDELTALARQLRQEEITAEVVELSAGVEAGKRGA